MGEVSRGETTLELSEGGTMRIISTLVVIWLLIGVFAAWQRGYFSRAESNCGDIGTVLVTTAAGPLNYFGANPKVECKAPEPSQ